MRYAIKMNDGSVAIMQVPDEYKDVLPDEIIKKWPESERLKVVSFHAIQDNDIPQDRTYRNAWTWNGKIEHDIVKARNVHRDRMRQARKPKMEVLDAAYMKADEAGNTLLKAQIATIKQELRDVPALPAIEAAATVEQLKTVWPDILK